MYLLETSRTKAILSKSCHGKKVITCEFVEQIGK